MPKDKSTLGSLAEVKAELWEHAIRASMRMEEEPLKVDARTTEIIASHFTLEREMEIALERPVAQPRELDRLGFGHKVAVLKAIIGNALMDRVATQLVAFNELRNAAAHPRNPDLRPLIQKLHTLLEEDQNFFYEDEFFEDDDILPPEKAAILLHPDDTPIFAYAGGIAGGLQAVVGTEVLARAALSGALKLSPKKKRG